MSFPIDIQQQRQACDLGEHSHHDPHFPGEENEAQVG